MNLNEYRKNFLIIEVVQIYASTGFQRFGEKKKHYGQRGLGVHKIPHFEKHDSIFIFFVSLYQRSLKLCQVRGERVRLCPVRGERVNDLLRSEGSVPPYLGGVLTRFLDISFLRR